MPEPRAPYQPPLRTGTRYSPGLVGAAATVAFVTLAMLDVVTRAGTPFTVLIGIITYGLKTAIGIFVVILGCLSLFRTKLPAPFLFGLISYTFIIIGQFIAWLLGDTTGDTVTYLTSPGFSVWSWLLILLVPIIAQRNYDGSISSALARVPVSVMIVILAGITAFEAVMGWGFNVASFAIGIALLVTSKTRDTFLRRGAAVLTVGLLAALMIIAGNRIYAIGFFFLSMSYLCFRRFGRLLFLAFTFLFLASPIIFETQKENIATIFASSDTKLTQDTRSFLYSELFSDLSVREVIVGRGFAGKYYSPYFAWIAKSQSSIVGSNNIWRSSSEVSWLNVILKFGILGLVTFMITVFSPVFLAESVDGGGLPVDGMRRFFAMMTLIFAGELPNQISLSYICWYICIGTIIANAMPRWRSGKSILVLDDTN